MTAIVEIRPREYQIKFNGLKLRQHYFTKESAQQAARTLK